MTMTSVTRWSAVGLVLAAGSLAISSVSHARWNGFQGEGANYQRDFNQALDVRAPSFAQAAAAENFVGTLRWNRFGSPKVLINYSGFLSEARSGEADLIARDYLKSQSALLGLSAAAIDNLDTIRISPLYESPDYAKMLRGEAVTTRDVPHVVLMRQKFAGIPAAGPQGLVAVGVARDGRVAFVSSSLTTDTQLAGAERLNALQALSLAAANVSLNLGQLSAASKTDPDYLLFGSELVPDVQRVRVRALPTPNDGVRRVYEVILMDSRNEAGDPQGFVTQVDAETGKIWARNNAVDHFSDGEGYYSKAPTAGQYEATIPAGACADPVPFTVEGDDNGLITITAAVTTAGADDDITIKLFYEGNQVASFDLLTQPEALAYQPAGGVPGGEYGIQVCPFTTAQPELAVVGTYTATPGAPVAITSSPAWKVFPAAPVPNFGGVPGANPGDDIRETWCWEVSDADDDGDFGRPQDVCEGPELRNVSSRVPWDALADGTPTFTTLGNNASTANSNISPITPDTVFIRPVSTDRTYDFSFTDAWFKAQCDFTVFVDPTRNFGDIEAATANLFAMHNRMHNWSYLLGFTEVNSNLQFDNYGNTGIGNSVTSIQRENDGELGSSQAGRLYPANDGAGQLGLAGRNNANQLTLFDGIPGITNQYLWQAWPGIIYPPACVDGAYEMSIIGHEYTHATSNRMTGGPDSTLGSDQDGRMGEAWSDLAAIEYQIAYGLVPLGNENPFAAAPYVTGDTEAGIRSYGINNNPLNYSNLEYDGNGTTSPHADSEIWGGVNYDIRQALIEKYELSYPYEDRALQIKCADGVISSEACPGNRRWIQLMFDGFLLQAAAPSMLDARDAMLAADLLRYNGANRLELWKAFATRGMGQLASSNGPEDLDPIPDFSSPLHDNAQISFAAVGADGALADATIYVGRYEARITPIADTIVSDEAFDNVAEFVAGDYEFIVQAPGYGLQRFNASFAAGEQRELSFTLRVNLASAARGAIASGDGESDEERLQLIDDTESTNWESLSSAGTASEGKGEGAFVEGRQVTVQLAEPALVTDVQVSAALHPGGQSRFTALRSFDIQACDSAIADCASDAGFSTIYESADDAFPGGPLRPKVHNLQLRAFDVADTQATHVRIVVRDSQCTGGPLYQGEVHPSGDIFNDPDCDTGSNPLLAAGNFIGADPQHVRIAELQVFSSDMDARDGSINAPARSQITRGGALAWLSLALLMMLGLRRKAHGR